MNNDFLDPEGGPWWHAIVADNNQEIARLRGEVCRLEQALRDAGIPQPLIDLLREGS